MPNKLLVAMPPIIAAPNASGIPALLRFMSENKTVTSLESACRR
jgi:hypothetical protein